MEFCACPQGFIILNEGASKSLVLALKKIVQPFKASIVHI